MRGSKCVRNLVEHCLFRGESSTLWGAPVHLVPKWVIAPTQEAVDSEASRSRIAHYGLSKPPTIQQILVPTMPARAKFLELWRAHCVFREVADDTVYRTLISWLSRERASSSCYWIVIYMVMLKLFNSSIWGLYKSDPFWSNKLLNRGYSCTFWQTDRNRESISFCSLLPFLVNFLFRVPGPMLLVNSLSDSLYLLVKGLRHGKGRWSGRGLRNRWFHSHYGIWAFRGRHWGSCSRVGSHWHKTKEEVSKGELFNSIGRCSRSVSEFFRAFWSLAHGSASPQRWILVNQTNSRLHITIQMWCVLMFLPFVWLFYVLIRLSAIPMR